MVKAVMAVDGASETTVVILCGGRGLRMSKGTDGPPKSMMEVGGRPILWHIMKLFAIHGFRKFVLCLGHGAYGIKEYFHSQSWRTSDFRLELKTGAVKILDGGNDEDWQIDFVFTGLDSETGERLLRARGHIETSPFFVSYGDDLCDVDFERLLQFHKEKGRIATLLGVRPTSPFGVIKVDGDRVAEFQEKPRMRDHVNGGFYVFNQEVFNYLERGSALEKSLLSTLARNGQLSVYLHDGFWKSINTRKDLLEMDEIWSFASSVKRGAQPR